MDDTKTYRVRLCAEVEVEASGRKRARTSALEVVEDGQVLWEVTDIEAANE